MTAAGIHHFRHHPHHRVAGLRGPARFKLSSLGERGAPAVFVRSGASYIGGGGRQKFQCGLQRLAGRDLAGVSVTERLS